MNFQSYRFKREEAYTLSFSEISGIKFTLREVDVMACIVHNRGTKKMASILSISPRTATTHIHNIMSKLQTNSRDYVIDFLQKAGKLLEIKLYYFNLITEATFKNSLSAITKLLHNLELFYSLNAREDNAVEQRFITELTEYLSVVNIKLVKDKHLHSKMHHIFISDVNIPKNLESKEDIIVLILDRKRSKNNIDNIKYIDFTLDDNFYFSVLQLINHIVNKPELVKILQDFEREYQSIRDATHGAILIKPTKLTTTPGSSIILPKNIHLTKISIIVGMIILAAIIWVRVVKDSPIKQYVLSTQDMLTTWNIPRQNIVFVGRENLLKELETTLLKSQADINNTLVISVCDGLGGSGKTQLALQYVNLTRHPYTMKIWFEGDNIEKLTQAYKGLAVELGYDEEKQPGINAISYLKKWLTSHPGWLMVIDNVENYDDIESFLPEKGGHLILTTRKRDWPKNFKILSIDVMTEAESIDIINSFIPDKSFGTLEQKKELAALLGYLPLALSQAGAYMHQKNISVEEYLELYKIHEVALLSEYSVSKVPHTTPLVITWDISLQAILKETQDLKEPPIAIELITVCSYVAPDNISRAHLLSWLKDTYPHLPNPQLTLNKHIELLWKYSMINYYSNGNISIHKLVQTILRHHLVESLVDNRRGPFAILNSKWYESLLQFFIKHESEFKLRNSFEQLLATREQFLSTFQNQYNDNIAELDLIIAPVYYYQERYKEFRDLLDKVDLYLSTKPNRELLKSKVLYLYSAYFRKIKNYDMAQEKIIQASNMFSTIKVTDTVTAQKITILKAKILFNRANLVSSRYKSSTLQNRDITSIKQAVALTREATEIYIKNNDIRNMLKSIELRGRLLILLNNPRETIEELDKYSNILEEKVVDDTRLKAYFYLTYADAYIALTNFSKALEYANLARNFAVKLNLKLEIQNIDRKIAVIRQLMS